MGYRLSARELTAFCVLTGLLALGTVLAWRSDGGPIRIVPSAARLAVSARDSSSDDNAPYVNVNTASVQELTLLPEIGPVKANAIVEYRTAWGPFPEVEALLRVRGIGPKTLERVRPFVTVSRERTQ